MSEELQILYPEGKDVTLQGQTFNVKPFTFGQMPKVIKVLQLAGNQLESLKGSGKIASPAVALTIIAECGEELIKLMADILKVEVSFIEGLQQDEATNLILAFFQVNADFFQKKVLPLLMSK